jgi:hypothetical protein
MKTTSEGLTHLVNMLVDVVNLQRKAEGTPGATCEVQIGISEGKATVRVDAVVDVAAPPPPVTLEQFGGIGDRMLTPAEIAAAEQALEYSGFRERGLEDGDGHNVTAEQAAKLVLAAVGLGLPRTKPPTIEEMAESIADLRAQDWERGYREGRMVTPADIEVMDELGLRTRDVAARAV